MRADQTTEGQKQSGGAGKSLLGRRPNSQMYGASETNGPTGDDHGEDVVLTGFSSTDTKEGRGPDYHSGEETDAPPSRRRQQFSEGARRCCYILLCCGLPWKIRDGVSSAHERGWTPFTSHIAESHRVHHYNATMVWTGILAIMTLAIGGYHFGNVHDAEEQWYTDMDNALHGFFAVVTLAMLSAAIAGTLAAAHAGVNHYRARKGGATAGSEGPGPFQAARTVPTQSEDLEPVSELSGVKGYLHRAKTSCDPRELWRHPTPAKTFGVSFAILIAGFVVGSMIDSDFFNQISDSGWGHFGAVVSAGAIAGLTARSVHWLFVSENRQEVREKLAACKDAVYDDEDGCCPSLRRGSRE